MNKNDSQAVSFPIDANGGKIHETISITTHNHTNVKYFLLSPLLHLCLFTRKKS